MKGFVANTDFDWFAFLRARQPLEEVNFWQPSGGDAFRALSPGEPFLTVSETPPATKATLGSNACHVTVRYDDRTGTVLALGAIDNLVKGASGQAVQAANLVLGLPEPMGLPTIGLMP